MNRKLLQGEPLIAAMTKQARRIEKRLLGDPSADVDTLTHELASVYLDGAISAMDDEIKRLKEAGAAARTP
jgi:hypothetical protein